MTNPFHGITDPKQLRALVQDGVTCERCKGEGQVMELWIGGTRGTDCPTCNGTGRTPLPNGDLDALTEAVSQQEED